MWRGGNVAVLKAVLDADVERNTLLEEERELRKRLEARGEGEEGGSAN